MKKVNKLKIDIVKLLQLFREELERVVGDSIRESGADGISALLSDVMNIKSGSKYLELNIAMKNGACKLFLCHFRPDNPEC